VPSIRRLVRGRAILVIALLASAASVWAILGLERRADASRNAQISLVAIQNNLNLLQGLPWRTAPAAGGSPTLARLWIARGEREIQRSLAALRRSAPAGELDSLSGPLRTNFALLERIRALSAAYEYVKAGELADRATRSQDAASHALAAAGARYKSRASRAVTEADIFTTATVLLLLAAFAFFYWRAAKARSLAELLAHRNKRLLDTSREEALTDHLTGLGNRRALVGDLEGELDAGGGQVQRTLVLFDLDGFKQYNDSYGHPAGDALLHRLASRLRVQMGDMAKAYRMGGDEFCVLAQASPADGAALAQTAAAALSDHGEGFHVGCSYGVVHLPLETDDPAEALRLADDRMYQAKASVRTSARGQSTAVLLKVLDERSADLGHHIDDVARLSALLADRLGLPESERHEIRIAAQLHDIGKMAVPDAILNKPGSLDDAEWELMHCHTLIGERIVAAAPALAPIGKLIRSSHERFDGRGYPDQLGGPEIPLGARIISVCDAFDAMVSDRPYQQSIAVSEALNELHRCAGTQFDPQVVETFCAVVETPMHPGVQQAA
jgi:diguanylate cyclase (GGDEF)-like protein